RTEAWNFDAVHDIPDTAEVAIIGSGLSMVDTVMSLQAAGHHGRIHVLSRHALLPLPHASGPAADYDPQPLLAMDLRQRMRALRRPAAEATAGRVPWPGAEERIRPVGQLV